MVFLRLFLYCVLLNFSHSESIVLPYEQFSEALGIKIKAPKEVDPEALTAAQSLINKMLRNRPDLAETMRLNKADLAIIPKNFYITSLPDFVCFAGQKDSNGSLFDSFVVRGQGGVVSHPTTATSEENFFRKRPEKLRSDRLLNDGFRCEDIAVHEFAHAIMNLGFSKLEKDQWNEIYLKAKEQNTFPNAFAMKNADEYWAELSQSFFGVNNEINDKDFRSKDPQAYLFLKAVYGQDN